MGAKKEIAYDIGSLQLFGDGSRQRYVINMFTSKFPTQINLPELDSHKLRLKNFENCLKKVYEI